MNPETPKAKIIIKRIPVVLPIHDDLETTSLIAQRVEDRLKRIEKESDTVDTQRFAVQAAYEFAAEMYDLDKQYEDDIHELVKALEHIATQLKDLERRYHIDIMPKDEEE